MDRKCVLPFQSPEESRGSGGKGCWPGDVPGSVETPQSDQSERLRVSWNSLGTKRLFFNRGGKKMREKKILSREFRSCFQLKSD